jgi:hypothetical protein
MSQNPLFTWVLEDCCFLALHFLENENQSSDRHSKRKNKVNQGIKSSFHYPSKKKYVMLRYVMHIKLCSEIKNIMSFPVPKIIVWIAKKNG